MHQVSSPSWRSLPSPLELEIPVPLSRTENQGHTVLFAQLWSGMICGKLGLDRPDGEKG